MLGVQQDSSGGGRVLPTTLPDGTGADGLRQMFEVEPFGGSVAAGNAPIFCDDCLIGLSDDAEAWFREQVRLHATKKSEAQG